jgi:predicted enzyme related to lactoylglutathione lyase
MTNLCFIEIRSRQPARCAPFYAALLDDPDAANADDNASAVALGKEAPYGAILAMPPAVPLVICCYLSVPNCAAATRIAEQRGSNVLLPGQQAGDALFSLLLDPWGNHLALWQDPEGEYRHGAHSALRSPFSGLLLTVSDLDAGCEFYQQVLGIDIEPLESPGVEPVAVSRGGLFSLVLQQNPTDATQPDSRARATPDPLPLLPHSDIEALSQKLVGLGGELLDSPDPRSHGTQPPDPTKVNPRAKLAGVSGVYRRGLQIRDPERKLLGLIEPE